MFKVLLLVLTLTVSGSAFADGIPEDASKEMTSIEIPREEIQTERGACCSIKGEDGITSCSICCELGKVAYCDRNAYRGNSPRCRCR